MRKEYLSALEYIYSFIDYERKSRFPYSATVFNLDRVYAFLQELGNPQETFKAVHIAGTKGKGSTAAMTESMLRHAGYKTGLFTSPHLHTFRERIRVDGELIGQLEFADLVDSIKPAAKAVPGITTFEVITGLAFKFFADQGVDVAVLEVGLGGRLDATNVIHPMVSAISSLSYDHTELLGHTISLIAWEKAGIIKQGVPVVSAPQKREAMEVIADVCETQQARLIKVGRDWQYRPIRTEDLKLQYFEIWPGRQKRDARTYRIRLLGRHQVINATVAYAVIQELIRQGLEIPESAIATGMEQAQWPARFEILNRKPFVVLDSAHNKDSAQKLLIAIQDLLPHDKMHLIFGASRDKNIDGMLRTLVPLSDKVWATRSKHPRAADPETVAAQVHEIFPDKNVEVEGDVWNAMGKALSAAGEEDLICVTGSIFVAAAAREFWAATHPEDAEKLLWVKEAEWEALQEYRHSIGVKASV